ncbi:MAG: SIS domain-containing protein [Patescibacteria group bacterium]|nr:SIS domain-containing protein [Patescibacteria group bacterium]
MKEYIEQHIEEATAALRAVSSDEIAKCMVQIQRVFERDGRIYIFGNGGSLALATHWVSDFNKTVFGHNVELHTKRFQAIRLPTTEEEYSAWTNDVGHDSVFVGPLQNYLQEHDCVIAISSSGNSQNVIKAAQYAKKRGVPVIALAGFDGGELNKLADVKILVPTPKGRYDLVEGAHGVILHLITWYFRDYFEHKLAKKTSHGKKKNK